MKYTIKSVNAAVQGILRENPILASKGITRENYHEIATHIYEEPQPVAWSAISAFARQHLTESELVEFAVLAEELPECKEEHRHHAMPDESATRWTQMAVFVVLMWQSHVATMVALRAFVFEKFCALLETDVEFQDIDRRPAPDPNCHSVYFRSRGHNFSVMWLFSNDYDEMTLWACNKDGPVFYTDSCALADVDADPRCLLKTWISESIHDNIPGV